MAVLITGGTGFIGAEIARQLVAQGVEDLFVLHRRHIDDSRARVEWGWQPTYDQAAIVADFLAELQEHPERYA